jgi:hypothetical protein
MKPTALETATAKVTAPAPVAAATKSTTTSVSGRPCYGCERHGCHGNYQINYLFCFHISIFRRAHAWSHCASVGYYDASKESLLAPTFEMQDLLLRALENVFLRIVFPSLVVSQDFQGDETLFWLLRRSRQSERLKRRRRKRPCDTQAVVFLITRKGGLGLISLNSVNCAAIVTKLGKP